MTVSWGVRSAFEVEPKRIHLGPQDATPGPILRSVEIRRRDGASLEVLSVATGCQGVTVEAIEPIASDRQRVVFAIDWKAVPAVFYVEALVTTNHPLQADVRIPISGRKAWQQEAPNSFREERGVVPQSEEAVGPQ